MITIKDIETCEEKLMQAMKNCDLAIIGELLHDDLLFNAPNGETITKDIDMAAYRSGNMVVDDYSISDRQISLIDDTAASRRKVIHVVGTRLVHDESVVSEINQ